MTLAVYAQCMTRSQIDEALVWQLMRFPDGPGERGRGRAFGPASVRRGATFETTIETTAGARIRPLPG
jgi:hypothetical protein